MSFYRELVKAVKFYGHAFRFIDKKRLYPYILYPALINLIAASFVTYLAWLTSGYLSKAFFLKINLAQDFTGFNHFLEIVIGLLFKGAIFFFYLKIYRYILLIFFAPVYAFVTEMVLCKLTHINHKFHTKHFTLTIWRAVRMGIRNFLLEILFSLCILIFTITITWLLPLAPILLFLVESFFFSASIADLRNSYARMEEKESNEFITHHAGLILGNGIVFNVLMLIPLLGILFAPILALIASIISLETIDKKREVYVPAIG